MKVTFTRTAVRRYRVDIEGPGIEAMWMEPAPGYHDELPHDLAHFVVENEMKIKGGLFGQLAAGGTAKTFHPLDRSKARKLRRRGIRIAAGGHDDAVLSESVVQAAWAAWKALPSPPLPAGITRADIERISDEFENISRTWISLSIGGSIALEWKNS